MGMKVGDTVQVKGRIGAGMRGVIVQQGPARVPYEGGSIRIGSDHYKVMFGNQTRWYPAKNLEIVMSAKTRQAVATVLRQQKRADLARLIEAAPSIWGLAPDKLVKLGPQKLAKHLAQALSHSAAVHMHDALLGNKGPRLFPSQSFDDAIDVKKLEKIVHESLLEMEKEGVLDFQAGTADF